MRCDRAGAQRAPDGQEWAERVAWDQVEGTTHCKVVSVVADLDRTVLELRVVAPRGLDRTALDRITRYRTALDRMDLEWVDLEWARRTHSAPDAIEGSSADSVGRRPLFAKPLPEVSHIVDPVAVAYLIEVGEFAGRERVRIRL